MQQDTNKQKSIKINYEFIEKQRNAFSAPGGVFRELLNVSLKNPVLSLLFILLFQIFSNSSYSLINSLIENSSVSRDLGVSFILLLLMILIILFLWTKSRDLYKKVPLNLKKVVISIVSVNKTPDGFTKITSYSFIEALLYGNNMVARGNSLEKIYLIASQDPNVKKNAKQLKKFFDSPGEREVHISPITMNEFKGNVNALKLQIDQLLEGILKDYSPADIVADFTGGTKELSTALYLSCAEKFILPAYLEVPKRTATGQVR
jgi:hypothetical protein